MEFKINNIPSADLNIQLNGDSISRVKGTKFLGVNLDENLNWKFQVKEVKKKLNSAVYMLRNLTKILEKSDLVNSYYGIFHSKLYAIELWGNTADALELLKTQKRAIRTILNLKKKESCKEHFKNLKILTIPSYYVLRVLLFMKKNLRNLKKVGDVHSYSTRQRNKILTQKHSTTFFEQGVENMGTVLYNCLPTEIKKEQDIRIFSRRCKKHLLSHTLYKIKDYLN